MVARNLASPRRFMPDECPACGSDEVMFCGLDVRVDFAGGDVFATWTPCCEGIADEVEYSGFEAAFGLSQVEAIREITGYDVLAVTDDDDASIVSRLRIVDLTEVKDGVPSSPPGWQANVFADVAKHHRHHKPPQGWKFGVAVYNGPVRVGVATAGRPVSRVLQAKEPNTLEVSRVATWGHPALRKNASSALYGAVGKQARQIGADKLVTYTLADEESGDSLRASSFDEVARTAGGSWASAKRDRQDKAPTGAKIRWERGLTKNARRAIAQAVAETAHLSAKRRVQAALAALRTALEAEPGDVAGFWARNKDAIRALVVAHIEAQP